MLEDERLELWRRGRRCGRARARRRSDPPALPIAAPPAAPPRGCRSRRRRGRRAARRARVRARRSAWPRAPPPRPSDVPPLRAARSEIGRALRVDVQDVAGLSPLDRVAAELRAQLRDVVVQRLSRGPRRTPGPELLDQHVGRDDLAARTASRQTSARCLLRGSGITRSPTRTSTGPRMDRST